jgi:hypothetical protein
MRSIRASGESEPSSNIVIASEAKQSIAQLGEAEDGLLRRFAPRNDEELNHYLPQNPAAIHLVFEIDHRRPRKMPGQAGARGAAADQFV